MAQQTGVDFLIKEFSDILGPLDTKPMQDLLLMAAIKQAKEMEKQQREDDYKRGWEEATSIGVKESYKYQDRRSIN
jgi:hypothetical protein